MFLRCAPLLALASCGAPHATPRTVTIVEPLPTMAPTSNAAPIDSRERITLTYESPSGTKHVVVHAPRHELAQEDVCTILASLKRASPAIVLADRFDGVLRLATSAERSGAALVLTCDERIPDGPGFLHPEVRCADGGPMCTFGLASGGTSVPPYERTYWFDFDVAGHATMVAVAIPVL